MTLSDINTILNAAEEIHRLRAELAERDAELQLLKTDTELLCRSAMATQAEADRLRAEQPRTDAEWKAADRKKRINDLAARYAGEGMRVIMDDSTGNTVRRDTLGVVHCARALAAAVVEAEE